MAYETLLQVENLAIEFATEDGIVHAVNGISFDVCRGDVFAIVGESGSGKTVTAMSVLGLLPTPPARIASGEILWKGEDLLQADKERLREIRGNEIAMIFQDPLTALNPVLTVGRQIGEMVELHRGMNRKKARLHAIEMLSLVGIPEPQRRVDMHPHEFSGGMRQRAMIAMAIACEPQLLIADEPTTALDVTVQAQVLELLLAIKKELDSAIILITHDLAVVAGLANVVMVMYAGRQAEMGDVDEVFYRAAAYPYTIGLHDSLLRVDGAGDERLQPIGGQPPSMLRPPSGCAFHPRCRFADLAGRCVDEVPELRPLGATNHRAACHFAEDILASSIANKVTSDMLLEASNLVREFPVKGGLLQRTVAKVQAVSDVSLYVKRGETLGIVGESGCGKSTLARLLLNLIPVTSGSVRFAGEEISSMSKRSMRARRRDLQIVFQDPYASLNPRMPIGEILAEPFKVHGISSIKGASDMVGELLASVGLSPEHRSRYPHEFSGGQRQRVGIARALALNPKMIILDEPVSALDVSIQAGVINLLMDLQAERELSYVFIAHDLSVVRHISDRIAVMYLGRIVETGTRSVIYERPLHPYTQALLSAVPMPDPKRERARKRIPVQGDVPSPIDPPSGCRFRTRCWKAQDICADQTPALLDHGADQAVACHFPEVRTP